MSSTEAVEETDVGGRKHIAKVVVCEDDAATLELLCDHLTADGFEALAAPTAADALRLCESGSPDILLLDLTLPGSSAIDVLRQIREQDRAINKADPQMGVIVVSGRGTERDRVEALGNGASDYVQKPFSYGELLARMNSVLRKRKWEDTPIITVGEIEIHRDDRSVKVGDREVKLTDREFDLLLALAEKPQKPVAKDDLVKKVLGERAISGHSVRKIEHHAERLGRKLDPDTGKYVLNCWGVAFVLVMPENWS